MMAVAFLVGLWTAGRRGLREGIASDKIVDVGPWLIAGTIIGARLLYVISYWDDLLRKPLFPSAPWTEIFMVQRGGLVFYGGLIGASLACILYVRLKKLPLWKVADILAPSIALGYVFGRFGCFLNGCCFGRPCNLPWAVTYPRSSDIWKSQVAEKWITENDSAIPLHPSQIYDSLLNVGLYLALAWLFRRKKFDGQVFAAYLMGYAVTRSIVETFRGDYTPEHLYGPLTPAHLISIAIFATGATMFVVRKKLARATVK